MQNSLTKSNEMSNSIPIIRLNKSQIYQSLKEKMQHTVSKIETFKVYKLPAQTSTSIFSNHNKISPNFLKKDKKHYRKDAYMKENQPIKSATIQEDINCILHKEEKKKEQNNMIVCNLREKFERQKENLMKRMKLSIKSANYKSRNDRLNDDEVCEYCLEEEQDEIISENDREEYCSCVKGRLRRLRKEADAEIRFFKMETKEHIGKFKREFIKERKINNGIDLKSFLSLSPLPSINSIGKMKKISQDLNYQNQNQSSTNNLKEYMTLAKKSYDELEKLFMNYKLVAKKSKEDEDNEFKEFLQTNNKIKCFEKTAKRTEFSEINNFNPLMINHYDQELFKETLKLMENKLTLKTLRETYKCLQSQFNPKDVINRILLALGLNPLDDFQVVPIETFTLFKKLLFNKMSQQESRMFLIKYFFPNSNNLKSEKLKSIEFNTIVYSLLKKFYTKKIINETKLENMYEKWKSIVRKELSINYWMEKEEENEKREKRGNKENYPNKDESKYTNESNIITKIPYNESEEKDEHEEFTKKEEISEKELNWFLVNDQQCHWVNILALIFVTN